MKRDCEYLVKMKEMDERIEEEQREGKREKRQLELSDVVPVAGLVMARYYFDFFFFFFFFFFFLSFFFFFFFSLFLLSHSTPLFF